MTDDQRPNAASRLSSDFQDVAPRASGRDSTPDIDRFSPSHITLRAGIITLTGPVTEQMYEQFQVYVLALAAEGKKQVGLHINSPGGLVTAGLGMYDIMLEAMKDHDMTFETKVYGQAASMGSFFLSIGSAGHRYVGSNARVMVHRASGGAQGTVTDTLIGAAELTRANERVTDTYVAHTGYNHLFWQIVLTIDTYLSADQCVKLGLADSVIPAVEPKYATSADRPLSSAAIQRLNEISSMSNTDVLLRLAGFVADAPEWVPFRADLVSRLADFPDYMTPARRAEWEQKQAQSNDNAVGGPAVGGKGPSPASMT